MNKLNLKIIFLIISFIFISFQSIIFIGFHSTGGTYTNLNPFVISNSDTLSSSFSKKMQSEDINSYSINNETFQIFDDSLDDYLTNFALIEGDNSQTVKIIIQFEENIDKKERISIIDSIFEDYDILANYDILSGVYLTISPRELISKEKDLNHVKVIEKIYKSKTFYSPYIINNLPETNALSRKDYPNWWVSAVGADNLTYDGTGVRVAVIDTGIYPHPDLEIVENKNFHDVIHESSLDYDDDVGHGTHVGGIIAGNGSASGGIYRGIAPGALLINARVGNATGLEEGDIINAIEWASKPTAIDGAGADIISMSFGGGYPYISDSITEAITNAKKNYGVIFVASAGNSGPDFFTGSTPASGLDVISVGATQENGDLASFSSWGPTIGYLHYPDIVAPGVNIISTDAKDSIISKQMRYIGDYVDFSGDGDYIPLSGTSMSCPVVAGALAILKQAYPYITTETARIALLEGAKKLNSQNNSYYFKSGQGLINISASLDYLSTLPTDYNDTAKIYPNILPAEPYDLLNFPGENQLFNLTVISGKANIFDFEIPNVDGLSIFIDQPTLNFTDGAGIDIVSLEIKIDRDAIPYTRNFQINLTNGGEFYDAVIISIDVRLPEYHILMESYHGLNDWFPENQTFYQVGFYEAMRDLYDMNISIEFNMEYWTPNYDERFNNSLLTEERLAQYDLIVLQNPILPYNYLEIANLDNYFNNGGNILFLGTRYQDLVVENINALFEVLEVDIEINQENIMNDKWLGIGASISSQNVVDLNNPFIFQNVEKFIWQYGNSFEVIGNAESLATLNGSTIAAIYNGTEFGKGQFLVFGDLHWLFNNYESDGYYNDHKNLLKNIITYLIPENDVSIDIELSSDKISTSQIDLTVYIKDQNLEKPLTSADYDSLIVTIKNENSTNIELNDTASNYGIYFNNTFNLPYPSFNPYEIELNLTIGTKIYSKYSKILYYDPGKVPEIIDLYTNKETVTRAFMQTIDLTAELNKPNGTIEGFLSLYSSSFFNSKQTINKTLTFNYDTANNFTSTYELDMLDPSGYGIFYILPINENYINPNSPRYYFQIKNSPPLFIEDKSFFDYGNGDIYFDESHTSSGSYVYGVSQDTIINFQIAVAESVPYEDESADMRVFINLFICSVSEDGYLIPIFPNEIIVKEFNYQITSNKFIGFFSIPDSMLYNSITGTKSKSTVTNFDTSTNKGYLSILYITVFDSDGASEEFVIILMISETVSFLMPVFILIISIIALSVIFFLCIYVAKKRKYKRLLQPQKISKDEEYFYYLHKYRQKQDTMLGTEENDQDQQEKTPILSQEKEFYCPFCGYYLKIHKNFCPNCGKSLEFNKENKGNEI